VREPRFVEQRSPRWRELDRLLRSAHARRLGGLAGDDVRRLGALYRLAANDLAVARTLGFSDETVRSLNRLCAAAHGLVYGVGRAGAAERFVSFLATGFPRAVRATIACHAVAAALFFVGCAASWVLFSADPDLADRTFGAVFRERAVRAAQMAGDERRYLEMRGLFAPVLAWALVAHNVRVTLVAFGLGCVSAVGGLFPVLATAASLGGGFAVFVDEGVPEVLWTFVAAHGPAELTAVFLGTGAGMRVGLSILVPGRRRRGAAFRAACAEALPILTGSVALLLFAGFLEGFVSPGPLPAPVKWGIGLATAAGLAAWLGFAGRDAQSAEATGTVRDQRERSLRQ
jgi:uncharacterized membrane protein SpoIIM required for sporulation